MNMEAILTLISFSAGVLFGGCIANSCFYGFPVSYYRGITIPIGLLVTIGFGVLCVGPILLSTILF